MLILHRAFPPLRLAAVLVLFALVARVVSPAASRPVPIDTINPVIGDLSFLVQNGRAPTAADDPVERIATHLMFAARILRARDVSMLAPALQANRTRLLDRLDAYARARRFPAGEAPTGRLPTWIDSAGTRCAVADLVDAAVGDATVLALDARFHNEFVAGFADPAFDAFVAASGFTRAELAVVQPTYGEMPPPMAARMTLEAGTSFDVGVVSDTARHPDRVELGLLNLGAHYEPPHNNIIGDPIVALDGGVGIAASGDVAYAASLRLGTEMRWSAGELTGHCSPCVMQRTGILAGLRVDADGDRIARAYTIPLDAYEYYPVASRFSIGLRGGLRFAVAGADRALGWAAGVDFVGQGVFSAGAHHSTSPRNVHVLVGATKLADVTFVGLTLGVSSADRYERRERELW